MTYEMDALINYLESGHSATELLTAMTIIAGVIVGIEKAIKWVSNIFIQLYKKKRGEEDEMATIDKNTTAIETLSTRIEELGNLMHDGYLRLDKKIDEQRQHLEEIDRDGKHRDCAILRDRILGGMRYFSKNIDENNNVHISITDFENMSKMFEEYEKAGGNGLVKHLKETEFDKFIVDTEKRF